MILIDYEVLGRPIAQPRIKAARRGNLIKMYTPNDNNVKEYKQAVREGFENALGKIAVEKKVAFPHQGLVQVGAHFYFPRPVGMMQERLGMDPIHHLAKPDIDNVLKAMLDALTGIAWKDDRQVWFMDCRKYYAGVMRDEDNKKVSCPPSTKIYLSFYNEVI